MHFSSGFAFSVNSICIDAQYFTAALVVVENLELSLRVTSIEAVEELLLLPNLKQLTLDVVSDYMSLLSIVSSSVVGVGPECSLLGAAVMSCLSSLCRNPSVISGQALIPGQCLM